MQSMYLVSLQAKIYFRKKIAEIGTVLKMYVLSNFIQVSDLQYKGKMSKD